MLTANLLKGKLFKEKVFKNMGKRYVIDSTTEKADYSVLRLSPLCCILNPIEMAGASLECLHK